MNNGKNCSFCGEEIRGSAKTCPRCGQYKSGNKRQIIALAAVLAADLAVFVLLPALLGGGFHIPLPSFPRSGFSSPFAKSSKNLFGSDYQKELTKNWFSGNDTSAVEKKAVPKKNTAKTAKKQKTNISEETIAFYESLGFTRKQTIEMLSNPEKILQSDDVTGMYESMGFSKDDTKAIQDMYKDSPVFGENTEEAMSQAAELGTTLLNSFFGGGSDESANKK